MFVPATLNGRNVKNRIIRNATNDHLGNPDGTVSDAEIDMYETLASNNVGTIITGHLSVSPNLNLDYYQQAMNEILIWVCEDFFLSLRIETTTYIVRHDI